MLDRNYFTPFYVHCKEMWFHSNGDVEIAICPSYFKNN